MNALQVRSLEKDNSKLSKEIHKWESYQNQEISNIKYVYHKEIGPLKEALNGISQQYNQLKVASEGLFNENQDMRDNIRKKNNDMDNTKTIVDDLHAEIRDLSVRLRGIEADKQSVEMKLNETLPELYDLRKKLDETKRMLDEENFRKANPISTRGTIIPKHITTAPGFSDLPSALDSKNLKCQPQMNQVPWMNR